MRKPPTLNDYTAQSTVGHQRSDTPSSLCTDSHGRAALGNARRQGGWEVPDQQGVLDPALTGQVIYCPNCGECWPLPKSLRLECTGMCKGLYTISVGRNADGNVAVVRIDRWR